MNLGKSISFESIDLSRATIFDLGELLDGEKAIVTLSRLLEMASLASSLQPSLTMPSSDLSELVTTFTLMMSLQCLRKFSIKMRLHSSMLIL
ncbi:hypothetical protein BpHYR1_003479 [Brachionus plicatilis]|uniref:Uncharacterized protein n=1 Tax=Brachionus plicatilis TaxID=10195 RepID=A0A3M7T0J3_BRAPC|nr:hypothetical protein BpHYR1_003479 [Brachionus plicatilis]